MSGGQDAFAKLERAQEAIWFKQEERLHMIKRLEKLVEQGRLDASVLDQVKQATSPDVHHATGAKMQPRWGLSCTRVEVTPGVFEDVPGELKHREGYVYAHEPGAPRVPRESETEGMKVLHGGSPVDMGPSRWNPGGGDQSIFSLGAAIGEPAAPSAVLPPHEAARLARLQAAAQRVEAPTLFGYRVAPAGLTPGKAWFWGGMLAVWGTAALVAASARGMGAGPRTAAEEAAVREAGTLSALGQRLANVFLPWRTAVTERRATRAELEAEEGEFVRRLKNRMVEGRA